MQVVDLYGHGRVRRGADFPEDKDRWPPGRRSGRRRRLLGDAGNALWHIGSRNPDRRAPTQLYRAAREVADSGNYNAGEW
jgi:hypothetical protein